LPCLLVSIMEYYFWGQLTSCWAPQSCAILALYSALHRLVAICLHTKRQQMRRRSCCSDLKQIAQVQLQSGAACPRCHIGHGRPICPIAFQGLTNVLTD
jgi:hypothetical protein